MDKKSIKQNNAITLIALVITIIVLLILAGISLGFILGENGILERAEKSVFVNKMKEYDEETKLYISEQKVNGLGENNINLSVGLTEEGQAEIKTILTKIKRDYEDQVIIQQNIMYYKYNETEKSKKRVKWCFESDIPVWGYNSYNDFLNDVQEETGTEIGDIKLPKSEYKKVGNIYMNTPDLSNLNPEATYYVTYDGETQKIAGRIDRIPAPEDWYNYDSDSKKWANIVTVTEGLVSYWVWIPKYAYKANDSAQTVDAKFISQEGDIYKDSDGNIVELTDYEVPEAFRFGDKNLPGYWVSKYEVSQEKIETDMLTCQLFGDEIVVTSAKVLNGHTSENYTVYIDGVLAHTGTLPYSIPNTKKGKLYDICLVSGTGEVIGRKQEKLINAKDVIKIDISELTPEATYYMKYDETTGNLQIANRMDKGPAPENWYDYNNKKWANIVTVTDEAVTYWTYIPRYEYNAHLNAQNSDIKFIPASQTEPDAGYEIPESFTFNGQNLSGYWISKYEVSESTLNSEVLSYTADKTYIDISTNKPEGDYNLYLNGEIIHTGTLPYKIENLTENTKYDIFVCKVNGEIIGRKEITTKSFDITIDFGTLDTSDTFYVYWDEEGEHNDKPISEPRPDNWYNYNEKKWANIVTKGSGKWAYWVYIPRYEYKAFPNGQISDIRFIPVSQTEPDPGYEIPESFTFAGKALPGYWISKYEVSQ